MNDLSKYQHFGTLHGSNYYWIDDDILLIVPPKGYLDNHMQVREHAEYQDACTRKAGKKIATMVVMSNVLSQEAETWRVYNE